MKKQKTRRLIILDWDDTLFPTSWVVEKNINLSDSQEKEKHMVFFSQLDLLLYKLLTNLMRYGDVVIVTNASVKWVKVSLGVLPYTKRTVRDRISIISARDLYQKKHPDKMNNWKKLIFKGLADNHLDHRVHHHIISIGDAHYEYEALIDLFDHGIKDKRVLKSIRFLTSPTHESLIDQLEVLNDCLHKVCGSKKHMDLVFNLRNT